MAESSIGSILKDGLWTNNQGLVALLGLCPLLAVTSTAINGLGLGLATMATLMLTNLIVASIRHWIKSEVRIPLYVLIIACVVTAIELLMNAHLHKMYLVLGIFLPLIVTNCAVIGRAEAFASKHHPLNSLFDGVGMGLGFLLVLLLLGSIREIVGYGTLFRGADILFGPAASVLTIKVFSDYQGFLMAILPPGAFVGLAVLIAIKNKIESVKLSRAQKSGYAFVQNPT
jgi:Na+-translocating ferredoxin:NAD+ oxidoreductase subunit E